MQAVYGPYARHVNPDIGGGKVGAIKNCFRGRTSLKTNGCLCCPFLFESVGSSNSGECSDRLHNGFSLLVTGEQMEIQAAAALHYSRTGV
jgi:hypothetical protein